MNLGVWISLIGIAIILIFTTLAHGNLSEEGKKLESKDLEWIDFLPNSKKYYSERGLIYRKIAVAVGIFISTIGIIIWILLHFINLYP